MSYFKSVGEVRTDSNYNSDLSNVGDNASNPIKETKVPSAYDKAGLYLGIMSKYMPASIKYSM